MGAMGPSAPMLFKVLGTSTHNFSSYISHHFLFKRPYHIEHLNPSHYLLYQVPNEAPDYMVGRVVFMREI